MLRVLIVDDEALARERLRAFLEREEDVEILGECRDGLSAVGAIGELQPDLVFLDVQMPGLDGFGVVEEVGADAMPPTIFVTAYDQYALRAFDVHALDYLLKPFDQERFRSALEHARATGQEKADGDELSLRLLSLIEDLKRPDGFTDRFVIKASGRIFFVKVEDIRWIEAAGNYVRLHTDGREHLLRETMNGTEQRLDPSRFLRIHRSTIVNLDAVREFQPWFHGEYAVILHDGSKLTMSRSYRDKMQDLFS